MPCRTIAVANQKGGTGKTATTLSLGMALARSGQRVLLVDTDPQGDLTKSLGWKDPDALESPTLANHLNAMIEGAVLDPREGILSHDEGVDLMPANIELAGMEMPILMAMSREQLVNMWMSPAQGALRLHHLRLRTYARHHSRERIRGIRQRARACVGRISSRLRHGRAFEDRRARAPPDQPFSRSGGHPRDAIRQPQQPRARDRADHTREIREHLQGVRYGHSPRGLGGGSTCSRYERLLLRRGREGGSRLREACGGGA